MPQVFRIGSYLVYFWANENKPLEPVHVHVAKGKPSADATKFWITKSGRCLLANNNSGYNGVTLNYLSKAIEANSFIILEKWLSFFGEIRYYC
ncbi:DUF4160 domain-containing protein [Ruminococcus sp.]|uniref:DUF4160 domain-containing protein n=1 Tax=Ruminococcus sp. TaxID=41978 RepID=UPI002E776D4C|nr:DUF4160 domain-containing protein [Ruminococcus sp.]MEE1263206.1 DUF4160 domain-containing protein [Ruminococcus sp.]